MTRAKRLLASLFATALMAIGLAPAASAHQAGLVNVDIDITENQLIVQVPIGVAANVCGVNAAVLALATQTASPVCEADVTQLPRAFQRR